MMANKENSKLVKNIFHERKENNPYAPADSKVHIYGENCIKCDTDSKGYPTPKNRNPAELVLDASEGFIPLWKENATLRWRFNPSLFNFFEYPEEVMNGIRDLLSEALLEWGWAPIKFSERNDIWDFEIVVRKDNCDHRGCTLARAFFPDSGRHQLVIYPKLFTQNSQEQIKVMAHELGHIFGLRHFFAELTEKAYPAVKFGKHQPFTIMNYGSKAKMTARDRSDLKTLYEKVWSGELTKINGTRIVTFWPFHVLGEVKQVLSKNPA